MTNFLKVNRSEVYRYMGLDDSLPNHNIVNMTEEIIDELSKTITPRCCTREVKLSIEGKIVDFELFSVESQSLCNHLLECHNAILFAATIGSGVDRVISKYSSISPSKAVAAQAAAAAMIEQYADDECLKLEKELNQKGLYLRPRFSPGYGDLSIESQKYFIKSLNTEKNIGLCLTDNSILTPIKSITAAIGITTNPQSCHIRKCSTCSNKFCVFRKE